jgi:tRNA modification GTPase
MSYDNRTIFAPITLVGESGITVIRLSGKESFNILSKFFSRTHVSFDGVTAEDLKANSTTHGYIIDNNEVIDEVVAEIYKSPHSFTGEDVVEISTHGGTYIYRKVATLLLKHGASHAEPGEFSKRAYLNGKIDLAQAEAIADLIKAKSDSANKLALKQLTGEYSTKIKELRNELINYCSLLELELDFSEEDLEIVSRETLLNRLSNIISNISRLTQSYESGKLIKNGVNLAIVGRPNVGKSSIFNYFLNENRAIVTNIPGTTRDYLQEPLVMDGIQFNLIDTAGIRKTTDIVEQEGVRRSMMKIEEADIVIEVEDLSVNLPDATELIEKVNKDKVIKVYNKCDIGISKNVNGAIRISAVTGENMSELHKAITRKAKNIIGTDNQSEIIITNQRHRDCLLKSCEYLVNAENQIKQGGGNELISFEIRAAMDAVTEILGKTANVDILNNIFSKFCIGK